ncbi:MAG: molybdopterin-synthase adenylyltransferase MoeB [Pseudomonadota bacterium]
MIAFLGLSAVIWGVGSAMRMPPQARWLMIGLLWVVFVAEHLVLPDGHILRNITGGDATPWIVVGLIAIVMIFYGKLLSFLRSRVEKNAEDAETNQEDGPPSSSFSTVELERYARHIVLREIGGYGQKALKKSRVLVVGAGGLGSPAMLYLAAAGVGRIGVIDDDVVDHTNLQRQIMHQDKRTGMPKVFSATEAAIELNPYVDARAYNRRLSEDNAKALFGDYDIILDGSDNFETRYLANKTAYEMGKPLISGALSQWEGQISVFDPSRDTPCYQCTFPQAPEPGLAPSCAEVGVLGPLPGVIGSMMAVEAVKLITGAGEVLAGEMVIYDALYGESRRIKLQKRADCQVCGTRSAPVVKGPSPNPV